MILFSERKRLSEKYNDWLNEHLEVKDCAFNVISFLAGEGLLDEKYIKEYLKNNSKS